LLAPQHSALSTFNFMMEDRKRGRELGTSSRARGRHGRRPGDRDDG
jgi:hypothetical protein